VQLRSLLVPYERGEGPSANLEVQRRLERAADDVRRALIEGGLVARVLRDDDNDAWTMVIEVSSTLAMPPALHSLAAWPSTRQAETGARAVAFDRPELARFERLAMERLTPFVAFRARLRDGDASHTEEFVMRLQLLDAPEERHAAITRTLLSNRGEVLRDLLYLLSGAGIEAIRALTEGRVASGAGALTSSTVEIPLLESLLRTLDREPSRLAAVRRIVDELSATEHGSTLLPDGWADIWNPVAAVAQEVQS
jgi:hypothetical protein